MKPTEKQVKVIDTILSLIKTWKNTNDIDSPTHYCDIHDLLYADLKRKDIITQCDCELIEDRLNDLLYAIQIV